MQKSILSKILTLILILLTGCFHSRQKQRVPPVKDIQIQKYIEALTKVASANTEDDQISAIQEFRKIPSDFFDRSNYRDPSVEIFDEKGMLYPPGPIIPIDVRYALVSDRNSPVFFLPILIHFKGPRASSLFLLPD
jgi:hypothetical protein